MHIYTDASGFAAGCAVTQYRSPILEVSTPKKPSTKKLEVPTLYDAFTFDIASEEVSDIQKGDCMFHSFP